MSLSFDGSQNFFRVSLILKGQRGRAVGSDDFPQGGQLAHGSLPEGQQFVGKKSRAGQQQHCSANQQNNRHQLALNRYVVKSEFHYSGLYFGNPEQLGADVEIGGLQ